MISAHPEYYNKAKYCHNVERMLYHTKLIHMLTGFETSEAYNSYHSI